MLIFVNNKSGLRKTENKSAAMSHVHLIAVLKQRLYNAVSVSSGLPGEIPSVGLLMRMMAKCRAVVGSDRCWRVYADKLDVSPSVLDPTTLIFLAYLHPPPPPHPPIPPSPLTSSSWP
jgi:hypothetical protein